jgi:protein-disulfide isomerase-like protein with CxxC motif
MKKTTDYLNDLKQKLGIVTDYELAKFLKTPRGTISRYQGKQRVLDDYTAAQVAEALGIDPMEVIAAANAEREKDKKKQEYWRKLLQNMAINTCLLIATALTINSLESGAISQNMHYATLICSSQVRMSVSG